MNFIAKLPQKTTRSVYSLLATDISGVRCTPQSGEGDAARTSKWILACARKTAGLCVRKTAAPFRHPGHVARAICVRLYFKMDPGVRKQDGKAVRAQGTGQGCACASQARPSGHSGQAEGAIQNPSLLFNSFTNRSLPYRHARIARACLPRRKQMRQMP
jgi:hypothetical protein